MNNNSGGEESDTDSKDIINRGVPPSNIIAQPIPGRPVARLNLKNKFEYLIQKTRVIVGRSGGDVKPASQDVDVSIDSCSLYISRRHFDVFTNDWTTFFVSVYSKNGLFVNGSFVRRGSAAYPLKTPSRLRFPKTDTKIIFSTLEREPEENETKEEIPSPVPVVDNDFNNNNNNNHAVANNNIQNDKIPTNIQNYNSLLQQHQQQQLNISSSSLHHNNNNDNMKMAMLSPQSKLEREVYKHQQQPLPPPQQQLQQQLPPPTQQQHQQQIQIPINRKRKFTDAMEAGGAQDWLSRGDYSDGRKPPFSYSQLIAQAIFSTQEHMLCLNDIYLYITKTYPFYRPEDKGWQNSIRHNLSLSKSFVRMPRANDEGKGSLWTIQPNDKQAMVKTAYRPRGTRDKYNALNHSNHTPSIFTPSKNSGMGDSEDSNEMYQNEDEEAANAISMSSNQHPPIHDPFNYLPSAPSTTTNNHQSEQFGDGDGDNMTKGGQSTILQSSFANPMQIFMQPPGRRNNIVQQQQQQPPQQLNNLAQLQRNNASGSLQVVRLSQLSNNDNSNTPSWQQQQQPRQTQKIFIPQQQPQQIKLQQVGQTSNNTNNNQRIIIVRSTQQPQTDGVNPTAKRIKLASPITFASSNPSTEPPKQPIIITQQQMQLMQQQTVDNNKQPQVSNNNPLDFNSLPVAQQQQILLQLQTHKKEEDKTEDNNNNNNYDNNHDDNDKDYNNNNDDDRNIQMDSDALTSVINENDDDNGDDDDKGDDDDGGHLEGNQIQEENEEAKKGGDDGVMKGGDGVMKGGDGVMKGGDGVMKGGDDRVMKGGDGVMMKDDIHSIYEEKGGDISQSNITPTNNIV